MCSMWLPAVFGEMTSRCGDLLVRKAPREEPQDLDLARRQPRRARRGGVATRWPAAPSTASTASRVEPSRSALGPQLCGRVVGGARGAVRPRLAHRLVRVGRAEDACRREIAGAREPTRIARSRRAARGAARRPRRAARARRTGAASARSGTGASARAPTRRRRAGRACPRSRSTRRAARSRAPARPAAASRRRRPRRRAVRRRRPRARRPRANARACTAT